MKSAFKLTLILAVFCVIGAAFTASAAGDAAADLSNYVVGVSIRGPGGEIPADGVFYYGEIYTIALAFAEGLGEGKMQFAYNGDGYLVYALPENIAVPEPVAAGEIKVAGGKIIGWYDIDETGAVAVRFGEYNNAGLPAYDGLGAPQNFIDHYTDAGFTLEIEARFEKGAQTGEMLFGADAGIYIREIRHADPYITVVKSSGGYHAGTGMISYVVTIAAHGDASLAGDASVWETQKTSGIKLTDMPFTSQTATGLARSNTDRDYSAAYADIRYSVSRGGVAGPWADITGEVSWTVGTDGGRSGFSYAFEDVELYPGDCLTVAFDLDFARFLETLGRDPEAIDKYEYAFFAGNDAMAESSSGTGAASVRDYVAKSFHIEKAGMLAESESDPGKRKIAWAATIGDKDSQPLNGAVIKDTITRSGGDIKLPPANEIRIALYGAQDGELVPAGVFTAGEFAGAFQKIGDYSFSFTVPAAGETIGSFAIPEIYRIVLSYATEGVPGAGEETPGKSYENFINFDDRQYANSVVEIPKYPQSPPLPVPAINKKTSRIMATGGDGGHMIVYSMEISVPGGTADAPDGWKNRNVYFSDVMELVCGDNEYALELGGFGPDDFTVYVNPYDKDFKHTVIIEDGIIYICFGGADIASPGDSVWQYSSSTVVNIIYALPLSEATPHGLSAYDAMREARVDGEGALMPNFLRNTAALTFPGINGMETIASVTSDYWPIHKTAEASAYDESVFAYTVTLNPAPDGPEGDGKFPLFVSNMPAIFTDVFDDALEYVPGSLYVTDTRAGNFYGPYAGAPGTPIGEAAVSAAMTIDDGMISVDLSKLARLSRAGGGFVIAYSAPDYWYSYPERFEIRYELRLKDPNLPDHSEFSNLAAIFSTTQNCAFYGENTVEYVKRPLSKTVTAHGGSMAAVEITINPHGRRLGPEGGEDAFTAIDAMDGDITAFLGSIKIFTQNKDGEGNWDGVWEEAEISPVYGELWSFASAGPCEIRFILPDETPVKIVYDALITAPDGENASFSNSISVYGYSRTFSEDAYRVMNTSATASAYKRDVLLHKTDDGDETKLLGGAQFELYMSISGYSDGAAAMIEHGGRAFYRVATSGEAGDGVYRLASDYITPTHGALFLIVETLAPEGYSLPESPDNYTFFIVDPRSAAEMEALEAELGATVRLIADHIYIANSVMPPAPPETEEEEEDPPPETEEEEEDPPPETEEEEEDPPPETEEEEDPPIPETEEQEDPPPEAKEETPPPAPVTDGETPPPSPDPAEETPPPDAGEEEPEEAVDDDEDPPEGEIGSFEHEVEDPPVTQMPQTGLPGARVVYMSGMFASLAVLGFTIVIHRNKRTHSQ